MLFEVKDVDKALYQQQLSDFLPPQIIDIHTHVWLKSFLTDSSAESRGPKWPMLVAQDNSIEDLLETYDLMFPRQKVTPLIFSFPQRGVAFEQANGYVSQVARQRHLPSLIVSTPEWSPQRLEQLVQAGGFLGLKPYPDFAPLSIPSSEVTIFDFLPRAHLEVANAHSWLVMLHIPRSKRLRDPVNLEQMLEIERRYPNVRLIIAHIGRAYCLEDVGQAFELLQSTEHMLFDFCATTNAQVVEGIIRTVGPRRVLFGSDMPILRMRMRRICENGVYINLVPPGLYGDISDDPHMREVSRAEGDRLSFFMYEQLLAFRRAAETLGLSQADINDIFFNNAVRIIGEAGGTI